MNMTSPNPLTRALESTASKVVLHVLTVMFMMVVGLGLLAFSVSTNPANYVGGTTLLDSGDLSNVGMVRSLLGFLSLFVLFFYRRAPLVVMIVGAFCALVLMTDPFLLAVGLTVWLSRADRRWHWIIVGVGFAVILINSLLHWFFLTHWSEPVEESRSVLAGLLMVCLSLVLALGLTRRYRRKTLESQSAAKQAQESSEQLSVELTRQREREELAREVHDTLASKLSVIALQTGSLEMDAESAGDQPLQEGLKQTQQHAQQALQDLRSLLTSLREGGAPQDEPVHAPTGISDVQDLFDDASASGLTIQPFVLLENYSEAPAATQRAVLRILQEALTNALRHSSDQTIQVRLQGSPAQGISLECINKIADDQSFDGGSQTGLLGLSERVSLMGGIMNHYESDQQFVLSIRLPWETPE